MLFPFAGVFVAVVWRLISPLWGVVVACLLFCPGGPVLGYAVRIVQLVRERMRFEAAAPAAIDLAAQEVRKVNWWSLRKAGFDCLKPVDAIGDPDPTPGRTAVADPYQGYGGDGFRSFGSIGRGGICDRSMWSALRPIAT